jgi:hypothetical protein
MLHDRVRMEAFQRAIFAAVEYLVRSACPTNEHPLRVLDVGTGYGILSYWAVEAVRQYCGSTSDGKGALPVRVYAVEGNPVTAGEAYTRLDERNILWKGVREPGEVLVLNTTSYRVPEYLSENKSIIHRFDPELHKVFESTHSFQKFDLIISETLGSMGDNEDIVSILDHAIENFLDPGGLVIPFNIRSFMVPIESPLTENSSPGQSAEIGPHQAVAFSNYHTISDYELRPVANRFDMVFDSIIPSSDHLSQPQQIKEWRFEYSPFPTFDRSRIEYRVDKNYRVIKSGIFSGFKGFFVVDLVDPDRLGRNVTIDISSDNIELHTTTDCWKHLYLPVEKQISAFEGDEINLTFKRTVSRGDEEPGFCYLWEGGVKRGSVTQGTFSQSHKTTTPFMTREPLLSRFVEGFAFSLEIAHIEETILPDSDVETKKILKHSLMNDLWEGLQSLKQSGNGDQLRNERIERFSHYAAVALSDERLKKCFLAFPSSGIEGDKYFLVSARDDGNAIISDDAQMVVYKVDRKAEPSNFVTIVRRPYDATYLEDLFEEVSKNKVFASALIVPDEAYLALSVEDIKDLRTLMLFLQVRIFVDILSADAQGRRAFAHQYRLTHELKQLADALSAGWMIPPTDELVKLASSLEGLSWGKTDWKVVPFPSLIVSVGRMITLWSGYYNPRGVFLSDSPPPTLNAWISSCWDLVKENLKVTACWNKSVQGSKNIREIEARFRYVEDRLKDGFAARIVPALDDKLLPWGKGGSPSNMTKEDAQICENWMHLTRWLISVMYNFLKHGEIKKHGLQINVDLKDQATRPGIKITATNFGRVQTDLEDWWPNKNFDKSVYKSWTAVGGTYLQQELARRLGTESKNNETDTDPYWISIPIAVSRLWRTN